MRPPLNSSMNSRPFAPLRLGFGLRLEFASTLIYFSPVASPLHGRGGLHRSAEVRRALLQECRQCLFCVFRTNLRAELLVLGLHCRLDLFAERSLHKSLA